VSSQVIYADRELQDVDTKALDVTSGEAAALAADSTYFVQNTGLRKDGGPVGMHHYACLIQVASEPTTAAQLKRARAGAVLLQPGGEGAKYKKQAGKTGYVWSPYGEVSVSINQAP